LNPSIGKDQSPYLISYGNVFFIDVFVDIILSLLSRIK